MCLHVSMCVCTHVRIEVNQPKAIVVPLEGKVERAQAWQSNCGKSLFDCHTRTHRHTCTLSHTHTTGAFGRQRSGERRMEARKRRNGLISAPKRSPREYPPFAPFFCAPLMQHSALICADQYSTEAHELLAALRDESRATGSFIARRQNSTHTHYLSFSLPNSPLISLHCSVFTSTRTHGKRLLEERRKEGGTGRAALFAKRTLSFPLSSLFLARPFTQVNTYRMDLAGQKVHRALRALSMPKVDTDLHRALFLARH